jgi:hypothetical protein
MKIFQIFTIFASCFILVHSQTTSAQFALQELKDLRAQVSVSLPNYATLIERFDELIQALEAELDPTGTSHLNVMIMC